MVSKRRPAYFLLEPVALLVAMGAGVLLMFHNVSKRAMGRPEGQHFRIGPGNGILRIYWPLLLAGVGALAIVLMIITAPGLSAMVFPVAVLAALSIGVAMSIRRSVLRR